MEEITQEQEWTFVMSVIHIRESAQEEKEGVRRWARTQASTEESPKPESKEGHTSVKSLWPWFWNE